MATRTRTRAIAERKQTGLAAGNSSKERARVSVADRRGMAWLKLLWETRGAQLLEFALTLPFLLVIGVAATDFGAAYNYKHILTNAAREGARITTSNTLSDASCPDTTPCSIEASADAVKQYLINAGLNGASCISPKAPSSSGTLTWTYSCNNVSLTINRGYVIGGGASGTVVPAARVTLTYPYTWTIGRVIGLLGTTITLPSTLTSTVVMQILVSG